MLAFIQNNLSSIIVGAVVIFILVLAVLLGVLQAILTGVIALPDSWVEILTRALITIAGTIALSQAAYQLLAAKLPDEQAKRAAIE